MGRCSCINQSSTPIVPESSNECLCGSSKLIAPDDGPNPCSDTFTYDISQLFQSEVCTSVDYYVESIEGFSSYSITGSTFEGTTDGDGGEVYSITFRAKCPTEKLGAFATLVVGFIDLCKGVTCSDTQECDKCTGNCVDYNVDLEVE